MNSVAPSSPAGPISEHQRAERRLGEIMEEQPKSQGTRGSPIKGARVDEKPTLAEAGIDNDLAHRARTLAAMKEGEHDGERRFHAAIMEE